jgi:L-aminopeptidase/D-esterase-like protein
MTPLGHIVDIPGISVGHVTHEEHHTGVTAVVFSHLMACGVDVRGGAPGTRETDVFNPLNLVETADAVVLSGGSAFGLDAATGAMKWLREQGRGVPTGYLNVPIVPAAVIFDLPLSKGALTPDQEDGYRACASAGKNSERGCVGAGAGATVGKLFGMDYAVKSGIGSAVVDGAGGFSVGALVVVNPLGDVVDPRTGAVVAGTLDRDRKSFADPRKVIREIAYPFLPPASATVIGVVAVSGSYSKLDMGRVARMAHDGIARTIIPSHTMLDGDTLFAVSTGSSANVDVSVCGALAAQAVEEAIMDAVRSATGAGGYPSARDLAGS